MVYIAVIIAVLAALLLIVIAVVVRNYLDSGSYEDGYYIGPPPPAPLKGCSTYRKCKTHAKRKKKIAHQTRRLNQNIYKSSH